MPISFRRAVALVAVALTLPSIASAQATPYLPNLDPAYRDLDALIAAGLVRDGMTAQRPYSRLTVARMIVAARGSVAAAPQRVRRRFTESLRRLETGFAAELRFLEVGGQLADCAGPPCIAARTASTDMSVADSPDRRVPTSYNKTGSDYIDAQVNPLLQRNQGRRIADGVTLGGEIQVDATLGRHLAASANPRLWAVAPRSGDTGVFGSMQETYLRAVFGNVAVDAGRNQFAHGHDREGGAILSNNARGVDQVRVAMDHPARIPGFLRRIGPVNAAMTVSDMGSDSDTPHSTLVVLQASFKPVTNVELGAVMLNEQGGTGGPAATFAERIADALLIKPHVPEISDKVFALDARLNIPSARTQLYLEMLTTDDHNVIHAPITGDWRPALSTEAVWIAGASVTGLGADGRTDFWAEWRTSGVRPHTHHQFTSGLTLDERIIGDPLGPLGAAVSGGATWRGPSDVLSVSGAIEGYAGADHYMHVDPTSGKWVRTVDVPGERRLRLVADWIGDPDARHWSRSVRLGYERVSRFAFTNASRSNLVGQLKLAYRW